MPEKERATMMSVNQPIPMMPKMPTSENIEDRAARIIRAPPMTAMSKRPSIASST